MVQVNYKSKIDLSYLSKISETGCSIIRNSLLPEKKWVMICIDFDPSMQVPVLFSGDDGSPQNYSTGDV